MKREMSQNVATRYRVLQISALVFAITCGLLSEFLDIEGTIHSIFLFCAGMGSLTFIGASLVLGEWWLLIPFPWGGDE